MSKIFDSPLLRSRIRSEDTQRSEKILGYFVAPCLLYMMYMGVGGIYLTQFYTDVLGLAGGFLTLMPLVSKVVSSITSVLIGRLIDRTKTSQGKARPWVLLSGPLLFVTGILLYAVPRASYQVQIAWIVISYNLFFSLAFTVYSLSHVLMVPLSTRNRKQRDSLAMLTSTGTSMIPGMLTMVFMPLLIRKIGVGSAAFGSWLRIMSILSILAIPATLIEYYFTRERVTLEGGEGNEHRSTVSFGRQISVCFRDRVWVLVILFSLIIHFCGNLSSSTILYYSNWVLADSIDAGATKQILVNVIGQAPLGLGVLLLWPLVRKYGKRPVVIAGFSVAALGSFLVMIAGRQMPLVLGGLLVKSFGALPMYVTAALLADALDHVEKKNGFRVDGFSSSVNSIIITLVAGLSQTILLGGIHLFGYVAPSSSAEVIVQSAGLKSFFSWCFVGVPMVGYILCVLIMVLLKEER